MYGDITAEAVGLKQQSQDMWEVTEYGKYFSIHGSAHGFVIMVYQNGSDQEQPFIAFWGTFEPRVWLVLRATK